ncbi:uncharacterized protein ACIQIH_012973 isoform 2-T6 [Cyanocitta cristata]
MGEMYEEILLAVRSPGFIVILQEESPFPKRKASEIMMEKSQSIFWVRLPKFRELQKRSSGSEEWILLIIHRWSSAPGKHPEGFAVTAHPGEGWTNASR